MSCGPNSFCMQWANPPVCHGTNIPCGPSPPPSNPCGASSYCKDYLCPAVCQGTNTPCSIPGMKYSCSGTTCVQDPNGLYNNCCDANCANPTPPPPSLSYCCNANTGDCATINGGQCPIGYSPISDCSLCKAPSKTVNCCNDSTGECSTATNVCPDNLRPVDDCTTCVKPLPPPEGVYSCCLNGKCFQTLFGCPQGWNQVSDCSQCSSPPPPTTVNCCETSTGNCKPYTGQCPPNTKQVPVCNNTTCPTPPPPSGTCPQPVCQGGFPIVMWSEHPPIGSDVNNPAVIKYFRDANTVICNTNPAGFCVKKFLLRLEVPVESDGTRNCFYPSLTSPMYTEFMKNLPDDYELYAMPYFDSTTSWLTYPDTPQGTQDMGPLLTAIPCNASCVAPKCPPSCPSGYQCVAGDCFQPATGCGTCQPGQTCWLGFGAKYPKCLNECKGTCCAGSVDPQHGLGTCCNSQYCDNQLAKAVYQVKKWNDVMGRPLFKGLVVDKESAGYAPSTISTRFRAAMRQLGVSYKVGVTYDGSSIATSLADLSATGDNRIDEAYLEVYNLTTQCNPGKDPWPVNSQLVDSYAFPNIGGCKTVPYPPGTNSIYAQAWNSPTPAQTLWNGNGYQNFQTIMNYGWKKPGLTQDLANRIYPLFSVETSPDSNVNTCWYPAGSNGTCGTPAALGLWNTVQGANEFKKFIGLFQAGLESILPPGSGQIPAANYGIFSFSLMPKAWVM